jgi:hypothetical protein
MSRRTVTVNQVYDPVHDYDLIETPKVTKLFRSKNKRWSRPGELAAKLTDHGDGVKINIDGKKINLNYAELQELHILLQATEFPSFKIK